MCMQGALDEWGAKVDDYDHIIGCAADLPSLAAGLASSGLLEMMLQDAAALEEVGGSESDTQVPVCVPHWPHIVRRKSGVGCVQRNSF